jgi:hypothetical protein
MIALLAERLQRRSEPQLAIVGALDPGFGLAARTVGWSVTAIVVRLSIPVNRVRGESGHADRDILGAIVPWRAVADPLASSRINSLTGPNSHVPSLEFNAERTAQDDGVFVELRPLPWLSPARGTPHVRDAQTVVTSVNPPDVLVDELGWLAGRRNPVRLRDQIRHDRKYPSG